MNDRIALGSGGVCETEPTPEINENEPETATAPDENSASEIHKCDSQTKT